MSQETIYVVMGQTGEYSDRNEWLVRAFKDEDAAKNYVGKLTEDGNRIRRQFNGRSLRGADKSDWIDPNFDCDYTGFNYYYFTTELY